MSNVQDIRRALEKKLNSISGLPSIAWENVPFNAEGSSSFIRASLTIAEMRPSSVGVNSQILYRGLFLLDVFYRQNQPTNAGTATPDSIADTIISNFQYATELIENSKTVRIRFAERSGAVQDPPWYFVPVAITWYAYI